MVRLANSRAGQVMEDLKLALQRHDTSRVAARVRRHSRAAAQSGIAGRSVTVLPSGAVTGVSLSASPSFCSCSDVLHSSSFHKRPHSVLCESLDVHGGGILGCVRIELACVPLHGKSLEVVVQGKLRQLGWEQLVQ